jgi:polyisoprenoid-binding protein YceI
MFNRAHTPLIVALSGGLLLAACSSQVDTATAAKVEDAPALPAPAPAPEATRTLQLDEQLSKVEFVGAKVTADHRGSFDTRSGSLKLDESGQPVGLTVLVDATSVNIEPEKLEQHLRSPDFFDVEQYPISKFELVGTKAVKQAGATHEVTGALTLRGVTKQITFPANIDLGKDRASATASFKINRKDFGIVYAGMADDLIKDDVLLEMKLVFSSSADAA